MDVVLKPKKLARQGKAKSRRPGKVGLSRLYDTSYPCLAKIKKKSSLPLYILFILDFFL